MRHKSSPLTNEKLKEGHSESDSEKIYVVSNLNSFVESDGTGNDDSKYASPTNRRMG